MKVYEEICGKYEGICGKYEGIMKKYVENIKEYEETTRARNMQTPKNYIFGQYRIKTGDRKYVNINVINNIYISIKIQLINQLLELIIKLNIMINKFKLFKMIFNYIIKLLTIIYLIKIKLFYN